MRTHLAALVCVLLLGGCFVEKTDYADGELGCSLSDRRCPPGLSCGSDGLCYHTGSEPHADASLPQPDAGACVDHQLTCHGKDLVECQAGHEVTISTCDNACVSGFCVSCEPDTLRCDGSRPQKCGATGGWTNLDTCPAATPQCEAGLCIPACAPAGARRCTADGFGVQECDAAGQFRTITMCMNVCVPGAPAQCGGVCRPGARQCGVDHTPEECGATGQWVDEEPCAGLCMDGACSGDCRTSDTRCAGASMVETCGIDGHWGVATACTFVCDPVRDACGGVCTPEARRCNGVRAELCDASGAWTLSRDCGQLPCTDGACRPCDDGTTQCNAGVPQRCVSGDWVDQRGTACPFLCDATRGCVGECVPGTSTCAGDVHRSCGTDALYDDETCDFVCIGGACAGVCEPGTHRCNGGASQTCSTAGAWSGGASCAFGCDGGTGLCEACVPESLDVTCAGGGCGTKTNNCGILVACPTCTGTGQTCGGGGSTGFCGCRPEQAQVTCQSGLRCTTTPNNCGQNVSCPDLCIAPQSCGAVAPGVCGCDPLTRETACGGKDCGMVSNGCGGMVSCWADGVTVCPGTGQSCGGGGTPNVCGCTPAPVCGARQCGFVADGCGQSFGCGTMGGGCPNGQMCNGSGQCVVTCVPKVTCDVGFECGTQDPGCGNPTLNCGSCPPAARPLDVTCDLDLHKCKCIPKQACMGGKECGTEPDGCGGTVTCGTCTVGVCQADQKCRCTPDAVLCGARECGTVPNEHNCPQPDCGDCTGEETCDAAGVCVCPTESEFCVGKECAVDYMSGTCGPYTCGACMLPEICGTDFTCSCGMNPPDPCAGIECGDTVDVCNNNVVVNCPCPGELRCSIDSTCVQPGCEDCPVSCCDMGTGFTCDEACVSSN